MKPTIDQIPALSFEALAEHIRLARINSEEYREVIPVLEAEMQTRVPNLNYKCGKCGHAECELVQLRSSGGFLSAAFNLQNQRFTAVVCVRCKFSELYHGKASVFQQAADFLIGG